MHYRVKIMALGQWVNDYRKEPYASLDAAQKRFDKIASQGRQAAIVDANNNVIADTMEDNGFYNGPYVAVKKVPLTF